MLCRKPHPRRGAGDDRKDEAPVLFKPGRVQDFIRDDVRIIVDQGEGPMNTKTVKNIFLMLTVLAMAAMSDCSLAAPAQEGACVEVVLDGTGGARGPQLTFATDAAWVNIMVVNSSGVQKGSGSLSKTGGVWHGKISVSETGLMTFTSTAGTTADQVAWVGRNTLNVTGNGLSLTVAVSVPAVGSLGTAHGYVFYDKGSYSNGWRYLEAAPADIDIAGNNYIFGYYKNPVTEYAKSVGSTGTSVGTGAANTTTLVSAMGSSAFTLNLQPSTTPSTANYAAKRCSDHSAWGYDDWFLPSKDELRSMYTSLFQASPSPLGGFSGTNNYWSSSEGDSWLSEKAWVQVFTNSAVMAENSRGNTGYVRAARAF